MDSELDDIEVNLFAITNEVSKAQSTLHKARKELEELQTEITHLESRLDDADVEISLYKRFIEQNKELWTAFQVAERMI
jgi:peptidoglycan hydrolase CwlO-like protein